ncbi:MAG: caspase family protein [Nitrospirota bacterium]
MEGYCSGGAWSVNISGNGKVAVGAFGDGTIRWYRMRDGKEIMALFPHNDKERWVLWTPSGYYDSSAGADDIIGWHLNNGKESEAYFFPISKFRNTYYRPDVIAKVLSTADEGEAIRLANDESGRKKHEASVQQMLPPVVNIISPRSGSEVSSNEITVRFSVKSPSGEPVTAIKALVDGRPAATERGVRIVGQEQGISDDIKEMRIVIPERDSEIAIIAENRYSASEPAIARLKWAGVTKKEEFTIKPKLYVLAVGVSRYSDKNLTLGFAAKDAIDFASAIVKQKDGLYRDVVVKTITDEKATKDEILDGLEWLQKEATSKDVAIVFLAGHGVNDPSGIYYFLPVNVSTEKLKRTGVPFSDIKNTVASLAGKTIMFIDTCHSGNIMGARRGVADITGIVNELASAENGVVVFASSTGNQYSLEDPKWDNGAFTKALVEGINGKADYTGKGKITINMLDLYLSERVKELTGGKQMPTTTKPNTIPDFPVAVSK